jgi:hypothetical protein
MRRGVFCCISSQQPARQSDSYARKGVFRPLFRGRHHRGQEKRGSYVGSRQFSDAGGVGRLPLAPATAQR